MPRRTTSSVLFALLGLSTISSACKNHLIDLPLPSSVREDDDDDDEKPKDRDDDADEDIRIPCDDDGDCSGEEHICHPSGVCTECVGDDDCALGEKCDGDDNECEAPKPRP